MVFLVPVVFFFPEWCFFPGMVFSIPGGFGGSQGVFSSRARVFSVPGLGCFQFPDSGLLFRNGRCFLFPARGDGMAVFVVPVRYFFLLLCFSLLVTSFLFFPFFPHFYRFCLASYYYCFLSSVPGFFLPFLLLRFLLSSFGPSLSCFLPFPSLPFLILPPPAPTPPSSSPATTTQQQQQRQRHVVPCSMASAGLRCSLRGEGAGAPLQLFFYTLTRGGSTTTNNNDDNNNNDMLFLVPWLQLVKSVHCTQG